MVLDTHVMATSDVHAAEALAAGGPGHALGALPAGGHGARVPAASVLPASRRRSKLAPLVFFANRRHSRLISVCEIVAHLFYSIVK